MFYDCYDIYAWGWGGRNCVKQGCGCVVYLYAHRKDGGSGLNHVVSREVFRRGADLSLISMFYAYTLHICGGGGVVGVQQEKYTCIYVHRHVYIYVYVYIYLSIYLYIVCAYRKEG